MEKITLSLPAGLLSWYTTQLQEQSRSVEDLVHDALREHIAKQQRTLPDWIGMIDVEGDFNSSNVKEWLH